MDAAQLQILKTELTTDPLNIGYTAAAGDHVALARLINTAGRSVPKTQERPLWELIELFDPTELATAEADAAKFRRLQMLYAMPSVNPDAQRLVQHINFIFGNPSTTRTRFVAWSRRSGSRAEELNLPRVTESDVADALLRT